MPCLTDIVGDLQGHVKLLKDSQQYPVVHTATRQVLQVWHQLRRGLQHQFHQGLQVWHQLLMLNQRWQVFYNLSI